MLPASQLHTIAAPAQAGASLPPPIAILPGVSNDIFLRNRQKYLLSTSDDWLSVEDVVLGYKQLSEIERVFRDLKHLVDIRPVYHRLPDRIKAHVLLCWLAMLLIRVAEDETGQTWRRMKKSLATLQVGIYRTPSGEVWQTNPIRAEVNSLLEKLKLKLPPRFYAMKPTAKGM